MRLPKHKLTKIKATRKATRSPKHKDYQQAGSDTGSVQMDEEEIDDTASITSSGSAGMKSKDEKQAIRDDRKKRNKQRNLYKIRNGNCTGKNGPRSINRGFST